MATEELNTETALQSISEGLGFNVDTNKDAPDDTLAGGAGNDTVAGGAVDDKSGAPSGQAAVAAPKPGEASAVPPAPGPNDAPKSWKPEVAGMFAALPPQVQAEIRRREEDFFKGIEGYKQAAGFGQVMHKAIEPFLPVMQHYKIDPAQHIAGLMTAHHTMALGTPQQKHELFVRLAKDYSIDWQTIASMVNTPDPANAPYQDPAVKGLTETVQSLQSRLAQQDQQRAAVILTDLGKQLDSFAADPKNVHFATVANDMTQLIRTGAAGSLTEAYEKAIWLNPVARAAEQDRLLKERQEADRKAAEARTAAARRSSGANVRSSAKNGSVTAPVGSIDDTLREAYKRVNSH